MNSNIVVLSFADSKLKKNIVKYVQKKLNKKGKDVTVEDVIETLAEDFPEVILMVAEENYIRGYEVGLSDNALAKVIENEQNSIDSLNKGI
jgi:lipoate-protein ligase A